MKIRNGLMALVALAAFVGTSFTPASAESSLTLYQGAQLTGRLRDTVDTGQAHVGDRVVMDVVPPYPSGNPAYQGATIIGHVTNVRKAGQGTKPELTINFDYMRLANGASAEINATMTGDQKKQQPVNYGHTALTTLGGMVVGNIIGKTIFHASGGGIVGAAGGALYGVNQKQNFQLPAGSNVQLTLNHSVTIRRQAGHG